MHVDAFLVGKYLKKITLKSKSVSHIDDEVVDVSLNSSNGCIKSVTLKSGQIVDGDFFIDCSGFHKVLMKHLSNNWISYQKNLPLNTGMPFQIKYKPNEMPEPFTTAWAQKNGWMWQTPLMDRKGCGYVFSDAYTTVDKAQEEIETILGHQIDPIKVIKFNAGRQESAWVKNCLVIGLSSALLEPLESTSIHSTIVQSHNFVFEYLKSSIEDTMNEGSRLIYNKRTAALYDDIKDFLVMHYMGGRKDSEFWQMINTGITKTPYVEELLLMAKSKVPSVNDFPSYPGSAGWPLYSFVMAGLNLINPKCGEKDLDMVLPGNRIMRDLAHNHYYDLQSQWANEGRQSMTYNEFISYFRNVRYKNGFSDIKY